MVAGFQNMADSFLQLLVGAYAGIELQQLRKAENGIERRAQFMAHARQERRLGKARQFGRLLGRAQALVATAIGNVGKGVDYAGDGGAAGVEQRLRIHRQPHHGAIGPPKADYLVRARTTCSQGGVAGAFSVRQR